jgi:hypothetical protein
MQSHFDKIRNVLYKLMNGSKAMASEGQVVDQQPVRMTVADVIFSRLPPGRYTVIARHPSLNPTEARQDVLLPEKLMLGVKYFYVEGERQLLRIELIERRLDV